MSSEHFSLRAGIQPEVGRPSLHHGLELLLALGAEAGVFPVLLQAVLHPCIACESNQK